MDQVTKAKKTFIKVLVIIVVIDLVLVGALVTSILNLRTGCDKKETPCLIQRGDGWCGIKLNITNYPYLCPYDGIECNSNDETVTCYGTYSDDKCPKTSCINAGALIGTVLFAIIGFTCIIMGIMPIWDRWQNYKMEKSSYDRNIRGSSNRNHGHRDTIPVSSSDSA